MEQAGIADFGDGEEDRPAAEAAAVAGNGGQPASEVVDTDTAGLPEPDGQVKLAVMQVDYKVEGSGDDEAPVVHVFGRTADGDLEHVRVLGFRPYFYAPSHEVSEDLPERNGKITGIEPGFESIKGESLTRVYGQTPRDVGQIRDQFDHYEADILFPNRLLIDKGIKEGVRVPARRTDDGTIVVPHEEVVASEVDATPRVNTFDIEVDDRSGFPEEGEEPIICLASHDSYDDEYVVWVFESRDAEVELPTSLPDYEPITDADFELRTFETEEAMLDAFLTYVEETDPDVLTGWNFDDFDAPYLLDRLERLSGHHHDHDLSIERLSRIDEVWRSDWGGPDVKGRVVFDLLYAYQRTQFSELDSYRLDAVAETELGVGKERYAGSIGDLWEKEPERLLEYNLRDVELCVEIDDRQQVIAFWDEVRTFVGCKLEDATTPGDAVDMYVLHKAYGNFVLPSKGGVEAEDYEGGAVFEPISGVKENVTVLDLKSLYPMCMATVNISPETRVTDDDVPAELVNTAPNGTRYWKEPDGIIREMIDELLGEREHKKERRNEHEPGSGTYDRFDRQQQAVKVIMNSLYGVLGWERFRLYDKAMGAAITATGREVIEFTEEAANDAGYEVVYGDTDSVMLELGELSPGDLDVEIPEGMAQAHPEMSDAELRQLSATVEKGFDIEAIINGRYDEFAREELNTDEHRFQIEFEKLYRRFFQAGKKKRYAGHIVWKEGKDVDDIDITGFEYKRSDIAPITKEVQKRVIEMIVTGEDLDDVKQYVREVTDNFSEEGDVDLEEIGIPGGIGKKLDNYDTDTAHVRGAKYANLLLGTNFQRGSKPKRLYLERVQPTFFERYKDEHPELFPNGDGMGTRESLSYEQRKQRALFDEFRTDPDVICFEYTDQIPGEFAVDWEKMLEKTLKGPIARILEALDVTWEEVRSGQQQTGLGSFT